MTEAESAVVAHRVLHQLFGCTCMYALIPLSHAADKGTRVGRTAGGGVTDGEIVSRKY